MQIQDGYKKCPDCKSENLRHIRDSRSRLYLDLHSSIVLYRNFVRVFCKDCRYWWYEGR